GAPAGPGRGGVARGEPLRGGAPAQAGALGRGQGGRPAGARQAATAEDRRRLVEPLAGALESTLRLGEPAVARGTRAAADVVKRRPGEAAHPGGDAASLARALADVADLGGGAHRPVQAAGDSQQAARVGVAPRRRARVVVVVRAGREAQRDFEEAFDGAVRLAAVPRVRVPVVALLALGQVAVAARLLFDAPGAATVAVREVPVVARL